MERCAEVCRGSSLFCPAGDLQGFVNNAWETAALFQMEVERRRLHYDRHYNLSDRSVCVLVSVGARVYSDCINKQGAAAATRLDIRKVLWCPIRSPWLDSARGRLHARSDVAVVAKSCHATPFTLERDHFPATPSDRNGKHPVVLICTGIVLGGNCSND